MKKPADASGGAPQQQSAKLDLYYWLQALVAALVIIILTFTFAFRLIGVDGSSMVPTLHDKDLMVVRSLGYTPTRGDIVVLQESSFMAEPIVKRVIATAGQTIDIDFSSGDVWVDGVLQEEPYINEPTYNSGDVSFPATVPEGCIFVMGDNRNRSTDSRWSSVGMVDTRCVIGKVECVFFPSNHLAYLG